MTTILETLRPFGITRCYKGFPLTVERNLRTVVSRAWQVNPDLLCRMAGYPLTAAPTASEFIEIIASYIIRSRQTS